jgi:hypothetical protein
MSDFHDWLPFGPGGEKKMRLDRQRLLLALKSGSTRPQDVQELLQQTSIGLELEPEPTRKPPTTAINHTINRFWVRAKKRNPITPNQLKIFKSKAWKKQLDWIGPVYRIPKAKGLKRYVCPLPIALLIKPMLGSKDDPTDDFPALTEKLARLQFEKVTKDLKYNFGYWYAKRKSRPRKSVYDLIKYELPGPDIEWANFDIMPMVRSICAGFQPRDPLFGRQWNMDRIHAKDGWAITRGHGAQVFVLDHGFQLNHPDLIARSRKRLGRNLDDMSPPGDGNPILWHGTACMGVVGASIDNQDNQGNFIGVAGLAGESEIVSLALIQSERSEVVDGIDHAVANHADVISISQDADGWEVDSVIEAIEYAHANGVLICAASGNDGSGQIAFPARHPKVMACGAMDRANRRAVFSNYGPELSVIAPGVNIPTTAPLGGGTGGNDYFYNCYGTSLATPQVAGLAALLISAYPNRLKGHPDRVRAIIEESAEELPGYSYQVATNPNGNTKYPVTKKKRENKTGFGLIDVQHAFALAQVRYGNPTRS